MNEDGAEAGVDVHAQIVQVFIGQTPGISIGSSEPLQFRLKVEAGSENGFALFQPGQPRFFPSINHQLPFARIFIIFRLGTRALFGTLLFSRVVLKSGVKGLGLHLGHVPHG